MIMIKRFVEAAPVKLSAVSFTLVLIYIRNPILFYAPRFWAEEGALYFRNAYLYTGIQDFLSPLMGYYSLFNKLAAYLALLPPLDQAPLMTTLISLFPIACTSFLITTTDTPYLRNFRQKILFSTIIILFSSGEIWLNTITSQFWLAGCVLFILIDDSCWSTGRKWVCRLILIMSGLTGVMSFLLIPLAAYRSWQCRRALKTQCLSVLWILIITLLFQMLLLFLFGGNYADELKGMQGGERFAGFDLLSWTKGFLGYYLLYPYTGIYMYDHIKPVYLVFASVVVCASGAVLSGILRMEKNSRQKHLVLVMTSLFITIATMLLSIGGTGGLRYAFLPNVIGLLLIFGLINDETTGAYTRRTAVVLIALSLLIGIGEYRYKTDNYINAAWPNWKSQIVSSNEIGTVYIWPASPYPWKVELQK